MRPLRVEAGSAQRLGEYLSTLQRGTEAPLDTIRMVTEAVISGNTDSVGRRWN